MVVNQSFDRQRFTSAETRGVAAAYYRLHVVNSRTGEERKKERNLITDNMTGARCFEPFDNDDGDDDDDDGHRCIVRARQHNVSNKN